MITLLTDFGTADGYVAEVKGILLTESPDVQVIDLSHDIPPQDVEAARLAVARYWRRFPAGTVHLVVVDPGVGSSRAAIAVRSDDRFLVGPDNGVLSPALLIPHAQVVSLPVTEDAAPTFHGRDVFAPAAAALASGASLASLGAPHASPLVRRTPEVVREPDGTLRGEVITIDRFGNVITNIVGHHTGTVRIGTQDIPVRRSYSEVGRGETVAVVGSSGLLEIAVREGNAAEAHRISRGTPVFARHDRDQDGRQP